MRSAPPPGARPARATVAARRRAARARKVQEELEGRGATRAGGVAARAGCAFDGPATRTRVEADATVAFARSTVVMWGVRRERSNGADEVASGFLSHEKVTSSAIGGVR
jgi:hypothetical protein